MPIAVRMTPRDTDEAHRASTPLELFFDLTFVVAVAQAASTLHHDLIEGHPGHSLFVFPLAFFGIWWAWMNFTWFASAYDTDDVPYRLCVFVLMTGVLIMAAGVPRAFLDTSFGVMTLGYVVMRLAMVALWLRAAAQHPEGRQVALRYAIGISIVQVGWIARLLLPNRLGVVAFFLLATLELAVPLWAERTQRPSWHPRHIAERYGLFTIIVLGESVLSAAVGVQTAIDLDTPFGDLGFIVVGGLLTLFSMWWIYFDLPNEQLVERIREEFDRRVTAAFEWGYGHYFAFLSAAATGAGLVVAVDQVAGHSELTDTQAAFAFTVPVALFLLSVWALHYRYKRQTSLHIFSAPFASVLILASSFTSEPVLLTGIVLAALVAANVIADGERPHRAAG